MTIYRIKAGRKPDVNIDDFIGETGTIWYDETTAEMRIYNGQPGGTPFNLGGTGTSYHLPIASPFRLGGVKVGTGLTIDADGALGTTGDSANIGAFTFFNSTISTSDSTNIFVDRVTTFNSDVTIDGNLTVHGTLKDQNGKPITGVSVSMIELDNTITNNVDSVTAIRFDTDSGFEVTNLGGGEVKIAMNSTFKYWEVEGQDTLIAFGLDTMKFNHGPSISITTDAMSNPKAIRFDTIQDIQTTAKPTFAGATLGAIKIEGSTIKTTDSSAITINQIVNMNNDLIMSASIIPAHDKVHDLGSPERRWRNIYVGGDSIYIGNYGSALSTDADDNLVWGSKKVVTTNLPFNEITYASKSKTGIVKIGSNIDVTNDGVISVSSSPAFDSITVNNITMGGNIDMGGYKVINNAYPINSTDVVNKQYVDSSISAISGGVAPLKTFNILGTYPAPIPGTARFQPTVDVIIKRVQLVNSQMATTNILAGFYVDDQIVQIFNLDVGTYSNTITGLNIFVRSPSYITVGILAGTIYNFSMGLYIS